MRKILFPATLLLAAGLALPALAAEHTIDIGGTPIIVPVEDGYAPISAEAPDVHALAQAALPPELRLVETFHSAENLAAMRAGRNATGHYMMIQAIRQLEPLTLSVEDWQKAIPEITSGMVNADLNALAADSDARNDRISAAAGREVSMSFGQIEQPQIYSTTDASVRFLMRIPVIFETVADDGTRQSEQVYAGAAGAIVFVRNKFVFTYWYAIPGNDESIAAARAKLDATVDGMVARNASDAAVASSPELAGGIDWKRVGAKAAIGALIGGLIGLVMFLLRRRKAG